ncbi:MAG: hypothetical protein ANABAC_3332 [Anaerolineae bacterium]|nr:MAG: hypothetical protein ANABAC_3332 [Anaerolineae bacterium]
MPANGIALKYFRFSLVPRELWVRRIFVALFKKMDYYSNGK